MKIKYITNVRIPTSRAQGYAVMKMCEEFSGLGVDLQLIVPNRTNNEGENDPFKYYGVKQNFNIKKVRSLDFLGGNEVFGKLFYWTDMLSFLFSLWFSREISKGDVLYTRDYLVPLVFSGKSFICLEIHDIPNSSVLFRLALKKTKLFFVLTSHIKNLLVEFGVSESKIHIMPSGVDLNLFNNQVSTKEAREKLSLPQDKKMVVYTGHFYKWKGVDTLAKSARLLPEVLFVFVGGVDPELREFKNRHRDVKNIIVLPFQPREVMPLYLKAGDVLVVPNSGESKISSDYTSPLKLFEYMASGRPVVASELPSIMEVLDEKTCVFAKPDREESFAFEINRVLSEPILAESISSNARKEVEKYTWKKRAEEILKIVSKNKNNEK